MSEPVTFRRILCAVDFSRDSLEAFRAAVELARLRSGAVHVLHVIEAQLPGSGEVIIELTKKANAAMAELIASAPSKDLALSSEVTSGDAAIEIVDQAKEWRADLVVLGARGVILIEDMIVGGTAEAVTRGAPCSVLVVRHGN
ncbi:MAG TPA: universal stress protein [Candidatus Saccharimonadales bacterium]|nr:universal stress protein [Candidatus Saccharimonadales bacterium]